MMYDSSRRCLLASLFVLCLFGSTMIGSAFAFELGTPDDSGAANAAPSPAPVAPGMIQPNTPGADKALHELDHAAFIDRQNAKGWSSGDSQVGIYYYGKADEARDLAEKLRAGNPISSDDVKKALDNSGAETVGGY